MVFVSVNTKPVHVAPPTLTIALAVKSLPEIVMVVPPADDPIEGLTEDTVGP